MAIFPIRFAHADAPPALLALADELVPRLLEGEQPVLRQLRAQYARASIVAVELSGAGFFVDFAVPSDVAPVDPADLVGGTAHLELSDVPSGAGCVLFVSDGYLSQFEGYTYSGVWTPETRVLSIRDVTALDVARDRSAG